MGLVLSMALDKKRRVRDAGGVLLLGVVLATVFAQGPAVAAISGEGVPRLGHVFVIIGENTDLSQVNGVDTPYIEGVLRPEAAWLTQYFAVTHYSEANYVAMTSGQFTVCEQNDGSPASCHQDVPNLFHQLDGAKVSWQAWMESMPAPCGLVKTGGDATLNVYAPKHNPVVNFDDVEGTGGVWNATTPSAECSLRDIPAGTTGPNDMSAFDGAVANGTVARFNLVVPNECEDGHDNCKPAGNPVAQFDGFLAREVPKILASPSFGRDGVLIVTFDEGITNGPNHADKFGNGGNVLFLVVSPLVAPGTYGAVYDHYSLLRTLEDGYGLGSYVGNAGFAVPIVPIWTA